MKIYLQSLFILFYSLYLFSFWANHSQLRQMQPLFWDTKIGWQKKVLKSRKNSLNGNQINLEVNAQSVIKWWQLKTFLIRVSLMATYPKFWNAQIGWEKNVQNWVRSENLLWMINIPKVYVKFFVRFQKTGIAILMISMKRRKKVFLHNLKGKQATNWLIETAMIEESL